MHIDPAFEKQISHIDLVAMSESQDVIYIVDSSIHLRAFNDAWSSFARNNNGETILFRYPLGATIADVGDGPVKNYIINRYKKALEENVPFVHDYECSSSQIYRVFHQTAYPIFDSIGLIITNHLIITKPHNEEGVAFTSRFENEHNVIIQCANCRKIRDPQNEKIWFWVPELVEIPLPNISHSICEPCLDHYYPDIES